MPALDGAATVAAAGIARFFVALDWTNWFDITISASEKNATTDMDATWSPAPISATPCLPRTVNVAETGSFLEAGKTGNMRAPPPALLAAG
ncbi:hypothetical protein ACVI1L_006119 [Bradyrhizobium sp. USDA 4516]